jgi:hypothetical protein
VRQGAAVAPQRCVVCQRGVAADDCACPLVYTNYGAVVAGFGGEGIEVTSGAVRLRVLFA